jgi:hypothetical protein
MSGLGLVLPLASVGETVEAARHAEQAGFESVWATEFTDRSATVAMAAMAAATELVRRLLLLHEGPVEHEGRFYRLIVRPTAPVAPPLRTDVSL